MGRPIDIEELTEQSRQQEQCSIVGKEGLQEMRPIRHETQAVRDPAGCKV